MKLFVILASAIALPAVVVAQTSAAPADPPPARVAQAKALLEYVMPESRMKQMMDAMGRPMFQGMMQQLLQGKSVDEARKTDKYFDERLKRTTKVLQEFMGSEMTDILPEMKRAMANAYARQFSENELSDLSGFFHTPSGQAYLDRSPKLMSDPAMISVFRKLATDMRERSADLGRQINAATADLPPPSKADSAPPPAAK